MKFCQSLLAVIAITLSAQISAATIQSNFDTDGEFWTIIDGGSAQWFDVNGRQFIRVVDSSAGTMQAVAPVSFLGDLSAYANGTLSFDASLLNIGSGSYWQGPLDFGHVTFINNGVAASFDLSPGNPPLGSWVTYSTTMSAANWGFANDADWITFLSDITAVQVSLEAVTPTVESIGFDSFTITTVPVPPAALLFGSGLLGLFGVARRKLRA